MTTEHSEWLDEMITSWVEVYKKSMTTLVLLQLISELDNPDATELGTHFHHRTSWQVAERALYRSLRRLATQDLLTVREHPVPKSGLKRKSYHLTESGQQYLEGIQQQTLT